MPALFFVEMMETRVTVSGQTRRKHEGENNREAVVSPHVRTIRNARTSRLECKESPNKINSLRVQQFGHIGYIAIAGNFVHENVLENQYPTMNGEWGQRNS